MVRKIDQIVRVVHFLFKRDWEIIIILHVEKNPICPRWVSLQSKCQIVVGLALKSGCKGYLTFCENSRNVSKSALYIQLITLKKQVVPVLLNSLSDRFFEAIDSVVHVAE